MNEFRFKKLANSVLAKRRSTIYEPSNKVTEDIEELLHVNQLKELRKFFTQGNTDLIVNNRINSFNDFFAKKILKPDSLNKEELINAFSTFFNNFPDNEIEKFFHKLDSEDKGRITWNQFCNHLLVFYKEKDYTQSLKHLPFNTSPKLIHSVHNQLAVTVKILTLQNPLKFINISRRGVIGIWSKNLVFEKKFKIDQEQEDESAFKNKNLKPRIFTWINDAVLIKDLNKLVLITSARELRIFSISSEYCFEDYRITGLPSATTCLDYYFKDNYGLLFIGFEDGSIGYLHFTNPKRDLFDPKHKPLKGVYKFYWKNLNLHKNYVELTSIKTSHNESIRKLKYVSQNNSIISASGDSGSSIIIFDLDRTMESYTFKLNKGCLCFDYDKDLSVLVTGSTDALVRVWNPYVVVKPVAILSGHKTVVMDVKIHKKLNYLYSLSLDGTLKVWDLIDQSYLQQIILNFPSLKNGKIPEYGPNPICLFVNPNDSSQQGLLLVSCNDHIAEIRMGEKQIKSRNSHEASILCSVYSQVLNYVATGDQSSCLTIWNIENGNQVSKIEQAHKTHELTAMCLDKSERRVFTGARDGSIKLWSMINGQYLQTYLSYDKNEITSLLYLNDRKLLLSVGWSKKILVYPVNMDDTILPVNPELFGNNSYVHKDDILCADLYMNMLVTGSYDGEINVLNTGTEKLLVTLRKGKSTYTKNLNQNRLLTARRRKSFPPIDSVIFLKHRASKYGLSSGFILSSDNGSINFWSLYANRLHLGGFYASYHENQNILALTSDSLDNLLVVGDTLGYVYILNIENYLIEPVDNGSLKAPECLRSWKCHNSSIVSCQLAESIEDTLLITSSTDKCVKLWTIDGNLIGSFGQRNSWSLDDPKTFANNVSLSINDELKQRLKQSFIQSLNDIREDKKEKHVEILPDLSVDKTISPQINNNNEIDDKNFQFGFDLIEFKRKKKQKPHVELKVIHSNYDYIDKIKLLKQKDSKYEFQLPSEIRRFKINNYDMHDERLVDLSKQERRNIYGDIDQKLLNLNPNKCTVTPYNTLVIPKVHSSTDFAKDFDLQPQFENFINNY